MAVNIPKSAIDYLSGQLKPDKSGVFITVKTYQKSSAIKSIKVFGVCQGSHPELSKLSNSILHSVTILHTQKPNHTPTTQSAAGNSVIFPDDIQVTEKFKRAYFEIDIFENVKQSPVKGTYFVSAVFGGSLSEVFEVEL